MTKLFYPKFIGSFHFIVLLSAFTIYLITAVNSKGYFHFDEHYQIIEFANLKLGVNDPSDLAWEYQAEIRATIQPAICVALFKVLNVVGITDPYTLTLSLRILTLLLSLTAISYFVLSSMPSVKPENRKFYIFLSYFLWFLPFLNVRFSSETWSGLLFLLAVAILQLNLSKRKGQLMWVGILLGFSFLCRFQSAFLSVGLLAWLIVIHKETFKNIGIIIGSAFFALAAGIAIDYWFYETLVFTPWNYFNVNILHGVASNFGTSPWHHYISTIFNATTFPIGCVILACFCILVYNRPKQLLLWIILPFLIAHSITPHKEDRFLIPLINLIPLMIILGWQEINAELLVSSRKKIYQTTVFVVITLLIMINVIGLAVMAIRPMRNGSKAITYFIHNHYKSQRVNLIYDPKTNPYNPLDFLSLKEGIYADKNVKLISIDELLIENSKSIDNSEVSLFALEKDEVDYPVNKELITRLHLKPIMQSIPQWIVWISQYNDYFEDKSVIVLYGDK